MLARSIKTKFLLFFLILVAIYFVDDDDDDDADAGVDILTVLGILWPSPWEVAEFEMQ